MRKTLIALLAAATIGAAALPSSAQARWGWGWGGFGVGLATGAIVGGALARPYYPYYGPGPWGPWASNDSGPGYSLGYTRVGAAGGRAGVSVAGGSMHHHSGRAFVFFGSPFYDPFYWSYIPPSIPYPGKVVTFAGSRVMSFQYLAPN